MKLFGFSSQKNKDVQQKYGVIKTSFFKYITPTMITVIIMCIALITMNFERVHENYSTNMPLNSLILFIFALAIYQALNNNINLLNVARFFKKIELLIDAPIVEKQDINKLKAMLETSAFMVNTQNTFKLVDNLQKYGQPCVTHNDAKLIKSKLGFRIRIKRSRVSFMGGLLVMLGLIGTFWGLLLTISSVGEAMNSIAEQADNLGSNGDSGVGGIITSISAPLQGMGLAFSTSLFGLSGSLVVGFFNYACSQAQDDAIEDFSRWIDENIPTTNIEEKKPQQLNNGQETREEKLIYLMGMLGDKNSNGERGESLDGDLTSQILCILRESIDSNLQLFKNLDDVVSSQKAIYDILEQKQLDLSVIKNTQQSLGEILKSTALCIQENNNTQKLMYKNSDRGLMIATKIYAQMKDEQQLMQNGLIDVRQDISIISGALEKSNHYFSMLENGMQESNVQKMHIVQEVANIRKKIPESEYRMIQMACSDIALKISEMDASLKENVMIMTDVVKEGNVQRMSRILKEMQIFWLQMKQNAFHVIHTSSNKNLKK